MKETGFSQNSLDVFPFKKILELHDQAKEDFGTKIPKMHRHVTHHVSDS